MAWGLVDDGEACETGGLCFRVDERLGGARCQAICAEMAGPSMLISPATSATTKASPARHSFRMYRQRALPPGVQRA